MNIMVILKDVFGYKIGTALSWDGASFSMDDGRRVSADIWPATQENLTRVTVGAELQPIGTRTFQWPAKAQVIEEYLTSEGWGIDEEMRIRPKLPIPFTKIKPEHIGPIIMAHTQMIAVRIKEAVDAKKLDPSSEQADVEKAALRTPVNLIWLTNPDPQPNQTKAALVYVDRWPDRIVPVPELTDDPGKFYKVGKQLALGWHDYFLIPKNQNVYTLYHFMQTEDAPFENIEEMQKGGYFITMDGLICKTRSIGMSDISINGFFSDDSK